MDRVRYSRENVLVNSYYQLPRFLFDHEFYGLSNDARVLYSILKNRHDLSLRNGWVDANGDVFLYFKRQQMGDLLHLSEKTVSKMMTQLKSYHLLDEVRQGVSKPNKIYLSVPIDSKTVGSLDNTLNRKIYGSRPVDFTVQDPQNLRPSYIDISTCINSEREATPLIMSIYGDFQQVNLSVSQYESLVTTYGQDKANDYIDRLDKHIASTGKRYADHYATIIKWLAEDDRKQQITKPQRQSRYSNFRSHGHDYAELEKLERRYIQESLNNTQKK